MITGMNDLIQIGSVCVTIGIYVATISFMKEQIKELKEDMKKYNNFLERLIRVEDSSKSAHKRINRITGEGD